MKQKRLVVFNILLITLLLVGFIPAQVSDNFFNGIKPTVEPPNVKLRCFGDSSPDNTISCVFWESLSFIDYMWNGNADLGTIGWFAKYLFLALIVILIYSSLQFVDFPENNGLKFALSLVVGFLSTALISTSEVIGLMLSYTALGITLITFFPIMILMFFTVMISAKANPMGIFFQKIMWWTYFAYLLIKAGFLLIAKGFYSTASTSSGTEKLFQFFLGEDYKVLASSTSGSVLTVLVIVALAVWYFAIKRNDHMVRWINDNKVEAEKVAQESDIKRSAAYDKTRAQAMEGDRDLIKRR